MNQFASIHDLLPVLPEITLACGAMLMLMVGAFAGEASARVVNGWSVLILIAVGAIIVWLPAGAASEAGVRKGHVLVLEKADAPSCLVA